MIEALATVVLVCIAVVGITQESSRYHNIYLAQSMPTRRLSCQWQQWPNKTVCGGQGDSQAAKVKPHESAAVTEKKAASKKSQEASSAHVEEPGMDANNSENIAAIAGAESTAKRVTRSIHASMKRTPTRVKVVHWDKVGRIRSNLTYDVMNSSRCSGSIALTMGGQMRTYDSVYTSLRKKFLDHWRPDVFISTWKETGQTYRITKGTVDYSETVSLQTLETLYSPCATEIEAFPSDGNNHLHGVNFKDSQLSKGLDGDFARSSLPNFFKIWAANELKKEAELHRGKKYLLVLRIRPDLLLKAPLPLESIMKNADRHVVFIGDLLINPRKQTSDKLAVGNSEAMDYYSSVFPKIPFYWRDALHGLGDMSHQSSVLVGERLLFAHMHISYLNVQIFHVDCALERHHSEELAAQGRFVAKTNPYSQTLEVRSGDSAADASDVVSLQATNSTTGHQEPKSSDDSQRVTESEFNEYEM